MPGACAFWLIFSLWSAFIAWMNNSFIFCWIRVCIGRYLRKWSVKLNETFVFMNSMDSLWSKGLNQVFWGCSDGSIYCFVFSLFLFCCIFCLDKAIFGKKFLGWCVCGQEVLDVLIDLTWESSAEGFDFAPWFGFVESIMWYRFEDCLLKSVDNVAFVRFVCFDFS